MGVPKFFRWISERYPVCSQLVLENNIPQFDNLYLDMNGIIHSCSHPNDLDVHFRMSEEQIFLGIFNYIEHLFVKIKPQKLFFMAVDGVAPRAKMNQQRARRFRTAKDAEVARNLALKKGVPLPEEPAFDSNCITPGTEFMTKLSLHLKYFINKKVTEDSSWQKIEIILSGHEVPGEGEHKIMEYLRIAKSLPTFDPNLRHCLYGLDADLIMLGLLSHEPHFALLREEVTFGKKKRKTLASSNPESQRFYLMHLSLFREYLDLEFSSIKKLLPFPYDLENIIDDFILMSFFVGNDFLPSLPTLHINEGALAILFNEYKLILPEIGGYLNDGGKLNLARCQTLLEKLGAVEVDAFQNTLELKIEVKDNTKEAVAKKVLMEMTKSQQQLFLSIQEYVLERNNTPLIFKLNSLSIKDKQFIVKASKDLGLKIAYLADEGSIDPHHKDNLVVCFSEEEDSDDEEGIEARERMLRRYNEAIIKDDNNEKHLALTDKQIFEKKFDDWKKTYYKEKLHFDISTEGDVKKLVFHYVEGLQWVLLYYYEGVPSWEWFYPYHYAPKITDLKNFAHYELKFDIGEPFLPFQQLMGVLPTASNQHIPEPYRELMTKETSPIHNFYPLEFDCDLNGKKSDWEAVVLIPFIDEKKLLAALKAKDALLSESEKKRNSFGTSTKFLHDATIKDSVYFSSNPVHFPHIKNNTCSMSEWLLPKKGKFGYKKGLCEGVKLGKYAMPGFPSMHTIAHSATLGYHSVNIFNAESTKESIILNIVNNYEGMSPEDILRKLHGKEFKNQAFWGYPFLSECKVHSLLDENFKYELKEIPLPNGETRWDVVKEPHISANAIDNFLNSANNCENFYSKKYGIVIGPVDIIVNVLPLKKMRLTEDGAIVKEFFDFKNRREVPLATLVETVETSDPRYQERPPKPVEEDFPLNSRQTEQKFFDELNSVRSLVEEIEKDEHYVPSYILAKELKLPSLVLARLTSSLQVVCGPKKEMVMVGLHLKFDSKQLKVLGYTRKGEKSWEFSSLARRLIKDFQIAFPEFLLGLIKNPSKDVYADTDFYSSSSAPKKMNEMLEWIKEAGTKSFNKVSVDSEADTVKKIEELVERTYENFKDAKIKAVTIKNVPRLAVLKPEHAKFRLGEQHFRLGERIIHVSDIGSVPIGAKGTIIGIDGNYLEIVFDKGFLAATNLDNRTLNFMGKSNIDEGNNFSVRKHAHSYSLKSNMKSTAQVAAVKNVSSKVVSSHSPKENNAWNRQVHHDGKNKRTLTSSSGMVVEITKGKANRTVVDDATDSSNLESFSESAHSKRVYQAPSGIQIEVTKKNTSKALPQQNEKLNNFSNTKDETAYRQAFAQWSDSNANIPENNIDQMSANLRSMLHIGEDFGTSTRQTYHQNVSADNNTRQNQVKSNEVMPENVSAQILQGYQHSLQQASPYQISSYGNPNFLQRNELENLVRGRGGGRGRGNFEFRFLY
ncbi:hypothetical protein HK099_006974 [Clydaea vesicula]|uniref:5'-3' exoribonuclease 1 n=1 Tax=Clydaea vesicula TaxID=447962 RepID=A0AAD5U5N8_9FUNG|nr:hypothetical protein HK099_006974 [Clydaea vesicula]